MNEANCAVIHGSFIIDVVVISDHMHRERGNCVKLAEFRFNLDNSPMLSSEPKRIVPRSTQLTLRCA